MLTDKNKALLGTLEAKYVNMLDVVNDIAMLGMGNSRERVELENYIHDQQQAIHQAVHRLNHGE